MRLSDLKIATRLYIGFGLVLAVLVVLVSSSYANFARLGSANDMNVHTYKVLAEIDAALGALVDIETGQRGFALTGKDASLEPYTAGKEAFRTHLETVRGLTADNPHQQERLRMLGEEQQKWLSSAVDPTIALRRSGGDADMAAVVAAEQAGKGKQGMDAMRKLVADIKAEESKLLGQRADAVQALQGTMSATLIGGGLIAATLAVAIAFWLARTSRPPCVSRSAWPSVSRRAT